MSVLLNGDAEEQFHPIQEFVWFLRSLYTEPHASSKQCRLWRSYASKHFLGISACGKILSELCVRWNEYLYSPQMASSEIEKFAEYLLKNHAQLLDQFTSLVAQFDLLGGQVLPFD